MRPCLLAAATAAALSTAPATAQDLGEGYDFDTLAACSVIYGRISELYAERADDAKSQEFRDTSRAYSASAFHVLRYVTEDEEEAYGYAEGRMEQVTGSLNDSSESNPDGDMGVVEQWLPYCDTLGSGVTELLERRESTGW